MHGRQSFITMRMVRVGIVGDQDVEEWRMEGITDVGLGGWRRQCGAWASRVVSCFV